MTISADLICSVITLPKLGYSETSRLAVLRFISHVFCSVSMALLHEMMVNRYKSRKSDLCFMAPLLHGIDLFNNTESGGNFQSEHIFNYKIYGSIFTVKESGMEVEPSAGERATITAFNSLYISLPDDTLKRLFKEIM